MNKNLKSLILTAAVCLALVACDSPTKRMEQAQALYNEGVQLREQRRSKEAAERFLQGLALVQRSDKTTETVQLEGQLRDNLTDLISRNGCCSSTPSSGNGTCASAASRKTASPTR